MRFCILLLLLISLNSNLVSQQEVYLQILLQRIEIKENNHVGNEWRASVFINDDELILDQGKSGIVKLTPTSSLTIEAYVEEGKEEYADVGSKEVTLNWENYKDVLRWPVGMTVTVEETNGRYAGNTATLRFQLYIHPTISESGFSLTSRSFTKDYSNPDFQLEENEFIYDRDNQKLTHIGPDRTRVFYNAYVDVKDDGRYVIGFDKTEDGWNGLTIDFDEKIFSFDADLGDVNRNHSFFMNRLKVFRINEFKKR